ncbi:MAG: hypothetical protein AAF335_03445, partial [Bacteroidota bacterium]
METYTSKASFTKNKKHQKSSLLFLTSFLFLTLGNISESFASTPEAKGDGSLSDIETEKIHHPEQLKDSEYHSSLLRELKKNTQARLRETLKKNPEKEDDQNEASYKSSEELLTAYSLCKEENHTKDTCGASKRITYVLEAHQSWITYKELYNDIPSLSKILLVDNAYTEKDIESDFSHIQIGTFSPPDTLTCVAKECLLARKIEAATPSYKECNLEDSVLQQRCHKIHSALLHKKRIRRLSSGERLPEANGQQLVYIGKVEDNKWWKRLSDTTTDEQHYQLLVQRMGIFRWQTTHGFADKQHQGLMHLKPKYQDIKEEVLYNVYVPLTKDNWNQTLRKSKIFYDSFARKRIKTTIPGQYIDEITGICTKWKVGQEVTLAEITVLKLYTDFDKLQFELKKCFRFETTSDIFALKDFSPNQKEEIKEEDIKEKKFLLEERLSSFYFWRTKLLTVLNKYAQCINDKELYHGINAKMILNNWQQLAFHGPLSTSTSYHVARTFSTAKGMVLTIQSQFPRMNFCRAFDASLISDYPEEQEQLVSFTYLRIMKVRTRNLISDDNNAGGPDLDKPKSVPLSSYTRCIFFAIQLFISQNFSMSLLEESFLLPFLALNCKKDKNEKKDTGQKIEFVEKFNKMIKNEHLAQDEQFEDYKKYRRIINILNEKFNNFRFYPNKKQRVKIDQISDKLKDYFNTLFLVWIETEVIEFF